MIASHSGGFATWATVSALTLATGESLARLPGSRRQEVEAFLQTLRERVALETSETPAVVPTIRAVAALGTLDHDDDGQRSWVCEMAGGVSDQSLRRILEALAGLRLMRRHGVRRRLWSVTPGVLADAILAEWLTASETDGRLVLTSSAIDLAAWLRSAMTQERASNRPVMQVLRTLARQEYAAMGAGASSVRSSIEELFRAARDRATSPPELERIVDLAEEIAHLMPRIAIDLALHILQSGDGGERVPWLLFHAAAGARPANERREIVNALVRAARREAMDQPPRSDHDGKSAARVMRRVMESIDEVARDFSQECESAAQTLLANDSADPGDVRAAEALIAPLVQPEGVSTRFEADQYTMRHYQVHPESDRAHARRRILDRLWELLEREPSSPWRGLAWKMLFQSRSALMFGSDDPRDRARSHLERAVQILAAHAGPSLDELRAARRSWSWHLEYDSDSETKEIAQRCEEYFVRVVRADPATNILLGDDFAADLEPTRSGTESEIVGLFSRVLGAAERLNDDFVWSRARRIAYEVGGSRRPECRDAWFSLVGSVARSPQHSAFLAEYLESIVGTARRESAQAVLRVWADVDARAPALSVPMRAVIYGARLGLPSSLVAEDLRALGSHVRELAARFPVETFRALGRMVRFGTDVRGLVQGAWQHVPEESRAAAFKSLSEGTHAAVTADPAMRVPATTVWLLEQLVEVPDPDRIFAGPGDWYVEQTVALCGRATTAWVAGFLGARAERRQTAGPSYDGVPRVVPLHHFVDAASPDPRALSDVFGIVAADSEWYGVVPEWLAGLDTSGAVLLGLMASAIDTSSADVDQLARAAGWARCFAENSEPWRRLAMRACAHAAAFPSDERSQIYFEMTDHRRVYVGKVGEVAPGKLAELRDAETRLAAEHDHGLRDYWRWRVADETASVEHARQALEEER